MDILALFRLVVADYCRERPCAVPVNHVAEGDKPLPYENDQAKVDTLALFRLVVFAEGVKPLPSERT